VEEFLVRYGAVAVFLGAMCEGDLSIVMSGVVAHLGYLSLPAALQAGILGAFLGDTVWYLVGRMQARAVKESRVYRHAAPLIERLVARVGEGQIVLARFVYGTRIASMFFWGVHGLPYPRFAVVDAVGCALSVTALALLGWGLSETAITVFGRVQRVERWLAMAAVVSVGVVLVLRALGRRAEQRAQRAE
jgi:membrane protein DedA with SNARE-associated domain